LPCWRNWIQNDRGCRGTRRGMLQRAHLFFETMDRGGEMEFLKVQEWANDRMLNHGFGTRGPAGGVSSKKDWRGKTLQDGEESFSLASVKQVHGNRVRILEDSKKADELWGAEGDAIITRAPGVALGVFTADCLPILLFDPVRQVVGAVHAGWRGTAKGIVQKAVREMTQQFQCRSEDMRAAMGPCIGPCCLEVDGPVKEAFSQNGFAWEIISSPRREGKWLLDLRKANSLLLEREGLRKENIFRLDLCTCCRPDLFYSYRGDGASRGRQLNFIALRKGK